MAGSEESRQYVLFHVGSEEYGLPISKVSSIIRYEPATPVPRAPAAVEGVINLRGRVIPVIDLGKRLFDTALEHTATSRIVVAEGEAGAVGLAVDGASEVATVEIGQILPPPETALSSETTDAFEGVVEHEGRLVILLDLDKAVPKSEYDSSATDELQEGDDDV